MHVQTVIAYLEKHLSDTIPTWRNYKPADYPFAVFDDSDVQYINHPMPPVERPAHLNAATAIPINDIMSATIPAAMLQSEQAILPLVYHEGFHVYQQHHFEHDAGYDFFLMLASYPELDPVYRALCDVEIQILNSEQLPRAKIAQLAPVITRRQHVLKAHHPDLLLFEAQMERTEGTAHYVEQLIRAQISHRKALSIATYGWHRFYGVGAAFCDLLTSLSCDWQVEIEQGANISQIILSSATPSEEAIPALDAVIEHHKQTVQSKQHHLVQITEQLKQSGLKIHYPQSMNIQRAFNPQTLLSCGDGQILHEDFCQFIFPDKGAIKMKKGVVLDDIANRTLLIPSVDITLNDEHLIGKNAEIEIDLRDARQLDSNTYQINMLENT